MSHTIALAGLDQGLSYKYLLEVEKVLEEGLVV
ncbi:MAG: hypothetical protein ACJAS1_002922 [Oleiphilaceae bacterium]|jgi:hypothetical protein